MLQKADDDKVVTKPQDLVRVCSRGCATYELCEAGLQELVDILTIKKNSPR
jgi:hypothetical protein